MAAVFQLDVLAASVPFFQGKCVSAVIPVTDGEYGVLAGHSNAVGAVCAGELRFETEEGEHRRAAVAPGAAIWYHTNMLQGGGPGCHLPQGSGAAQQGRNAATVRQKEEDRTCVLWI